MEGGKDGSMEVWEGRREEGAINRESSRRELLFGQTAVGDTPSISAAAAEVDEVLPLPLLVPLLLPVPLAPPPPLDQSSRFIFLRHLLPLSSSCKLSTPASCEVTAASDEPTVGGMYG